LERQEIRAWVRSLDLGVRQSVVIATKDRRILEAMLTAPPELSGIASPKAAAEIEDRYIELTYPKELAELEAMEAVVAAGEAGLAVARNDMQSVAGHLHPHEFNELMKPIESKAAAPTEPPKAPPDRTRPPAPEFSPEFEEIWARFDKMVDASVA
jgi:hypothetical protein